jgi:hypothetical protein
VRTDCRGFPRDGSVREADQAAEIFVPYLGTIPCPDTGFVFGGPRAVGYTFSPVFQGAEAPRQVLVVLIGASQAPRRLPEARLAKHVKRLY